MAIPASVLLYTNWKNANFSTPMYTQVSPEKPVGFVWTTHNSVTIGDGADPWPAGQEVCDLDNHAAGQVYATVSPATVPASAGRICVELSPSSGVGTGYIWGMNATNDQNFRLRLQRTSSGDLNLSFRFNATNSTNDIALGAEPANKYKIEMIYDSQNATGSLRLRARPWLIGGSPGSFVDSTPSGAAAATDQPTSIYFSDAQNGPYTGLEAGRVAVSNDIAEDLSNLTEGAGGVAALVQFYNQLRD
jgi:hypothetical protein